jgi:signal transduction histidine kinase
VGYGHKWLYKGCGFFSNATVVPLEANRLFCQLSPEELSWLGQIAKEQTYGAGQEIFEEGQKGDGMYVVKDGLVEISVLVGPNARRVFSRITPGDMFGEMSVLDEMPRSARAVAVNETAVYFIGREEILALLARSRALSQSLLREISLRLREFDQQYLREVLQVERLALIGRFTRSIVHDLKSPLSVLGTVAETVCLPHCPPEARQEAAGMVRKQIEVINDLVGEILTYTRTLPSDRSLDLIDYSAFVMQFLEEARTAAVQESATLEVESPLPSVQVRVNPKRLRRVWLNLIQNATDAMPQGGRIRLRFEVRPTELVTEVEDSGPGIAPEVAGQLFEAFVTHGKEHGTGLGLSICKRIMEDHGGWIAARNSPRGGAVFSFGLPLPGGNADGGNFQ